MLAKFQDESPTKSDDDAGEQLSAASSTPSSLPGFERDPMPSTESVSVEASQLGPIKTELELLRSVISQTVRLGRERERILGQLHQENQSLRAGELERAISPVLRDLMRLSDDLAASAARFRNSPDSGSDLLAQELDDLGDSVVDILYRQGCEPYAPAVGARFDAKEQRPSAVRETSEQVMDGCVAEVIKQGFRHNGRVLRPAHVIVTRYRPEAAPMSGDSKEQRQAVAGVGE
jgi:molecular chaperone GrpE (heat shock protein)